MKNENPVVGLGIYVDDLKKTNRLRKPKSITKFSLCLFILMGIFSPNITHAQVCTFLGGECCGEGITNFKLNGAPAIDRNSTVTENAGFTNTGLSTSVVSGQTYEYSVTFPVEDNVVNCNTYNFKIYVDYNQNDLLTDAGEEVVSLSNVVNGTHTGSFTIPNTALNGNAYMRVMMKMAASSQSGGFCGHIPITPCNDPPDGTGFHGEVENYTLNITDVTGTENLENSSNVSIYPNPGYGQFTVNCNNITSIEIYELLGNRIYSITNDGQQSTRAIDISHSPKGIYSVKIYDGKTIFSKKIVIL